MTRSSLGEGLSACLDRVWQSRESHYTAAQQCLPKLEVSDWLILAGWDSAATYCPQGGVLRFEFPDQVSVSDSLGQQLLKGRLTHNGSGMAAKGQPAVQYEGWGYAVVLDPAVKELISHDPASLIAAMQWIRDHLDTALLKPSEMRDREVNDISRTSRLDPDHFRRLALWFPEVAKVLRVR